MEYELVDLGLPSGTLWMDRNIGASSPSDYGLYFAWGETDGYTSNEADSKKQFNWTNYKFGNGNKFLCQDDRVFGSIFTKYNSTDGLTNLENVDDVVYQNTNGECCMPTKEQLLELMFNIRDKWGKQNGVFGCYLFSKINGKSIFVPYAGDVSNLYLGDGNIGCYAYLWSSSLFEEYMSCAFYLACGFERNYCTYKSRFVGSSIRGVKVKK